MQGFHIAGHEVLIIPAADRDRLACVQGKRIPLYPRHMGQIDQIAEMAQAKALLLEFLF